MSKTTELKKCPFCGGNARLQRKGIGMDGEFHREDWEISCGNCGAEPSGKLYISKFHITAQGDLKYINDGRVQAIEAWNRRAE